MLDQDHQVILGGINFTTTEVVLPIQLSDVDLAEVFRAVAHRILKEKPVDQGGN